MLVAAQNFEACLFSFLALSCCLVWQAEAAAASREPRQLAEGLLFFGEGENEVTSEGIGVVQKDMERYAGRTFAGGKYHGMGVLVLSDGTVYSGQFVDGRYSGRGTIAFSGGDEYSGGFLNGSFHGYGSYRRADGTVRSGVFNRGRSS